MQFREMQVLLTGATGGIGRELAHQLAAKGARVITLGRHPETLEQLASSLPETGTDPHAWLALDLCAPGQRRELADKLEARGLAPNVLINLAGSNLFGLFENQREQDLEALLQTNLNATVLLTHALLPMLLRRPEARIFNVGSTFGSIGHPGYVAYCTTKFALRGFSEALHRELADSNIQVQYCAPRATRTALNCDAACALNRELHNQVDEPAAVARALIVQLASGETNRYLGWPEKLFVRINSLWPALVSSSISRRLPIIKRYASADGDPDNPLKEARI
ncbi:SDR family oxidoreductase [Motiliproteus sp. SC1-56]|uniref:SDR family oxidoreductase n=1 Tax=Motiliproteus sp. SC1-56 TaxID=2799565 RepID=UPI001A8CFE46|nr:SDR family oxidoreductase [Motiliproteus sp. SC1-56]